MDVRSSLSSPIAAELCCAPIVQQEALANQKREAHVACGVLPIAR